MTVETPITDPVTPGEVSVHLAYIRRDLAKLNEKMDGISSNFVSTADFKEHLVTDADHEARLRRLENWGAMAIGALALLQVFIKLFWK